MSASTDTVSKEVALIAMFWQCDMSVKVDPVMSLCRATWRRFYVLLNIIMQTADEGIAVCRQSCPKNRIVVAAAVEKQKISV